MIKKLQRKFIGIAMFSLMAVLILIIGVINIVNYRSITQDADEVLTLLVNNEGHFPGRDPQHNKNEAPHPRPMSPELPFQSRFCSVVISKEGTIVVTNTENIAAIDHTTAQKMALKVYRSGDKQGFSGNYRYMAKEKSDGNTLIIFLDCTTNLATFRNFLLASCIISLAGFAAVFLLILLLSKRMVRPFSETYEKQRQFITDAGHELKTPITIIDADAEILEMDHPDSEWLQDIRKQTKRLSTLTNDLIYLSRMEEDKPQMTMIDFPLSDVVSETIQSFLAPAKTQNQTIDAEITPFMSLCGDEKAIRQLITILMDNALKYTPKGGEIRIHLGTSGKMAALSIKNTVAAPIQDVDKLFDRFYRADASRNAQTGGHGIGLSIAKAIVSGHKGRISAQMASTDSFEIRVMLPVG